MAIGKKMEKEFNVQLQRELYSAYLYLAMAAYFETTGLKGFAHWMKTQAQEERNHGDRFYDFIVSRGGMVELEAIEKPPQKWDSPLNAFEETLKHEESVTAFIHDLADLSISEKDHAAHSFLKYFIDEQVEEEDTANDIIAKLKLVKDSAGGLFMLDAELKGRPQPIAGNTGAV